MPARPPKKLKVGQTDFPYEDIQTSPSGSLQLKMYIIKSNNNAIAIPYDIKIFAINFEYICKSTVLNFILYKVEKI